MAKELSSGTLLYRKRGEYYEVLIVHPSGNYNKKAAWSIPKGKLEKNETAEDAARRETWEETGVHSPEKLHPLGEVVYKSNKKRVYCFAGEALSDSTPNLDSWEVDRVEFVSLDEAERILHEAQKEFIVRLKKYLKSNA